ncbi:WAT1-related protein At4g19185-like isoform X3 [Papaver somniferum]|uniref:WAT1-related protein At4g19185-like isoform X3 n=1 Tax=Papaver somniferum TaxID=3469 RepID=UPI000E6FD5BC|nr:WAT1-related protein At4g19185-like isoform X3 [Papaver somniferum]
MAGGVVMERETIWKAHSTLAVVQILYGGYHIISSVALKAGINQIVFCVCRDLISLSLLAPIAYFRDSTEKVNLLKTEGQLKAGGTLVCVSGAILMVLFKGPAIFGNNVSELLHGEATNEIIARAHQEPAGWFISDLLDIGLTKFHIGMFCLIGNCFCVAAYLSLQAPLLLKYPASLSMTAYSQFFGTMLMVIAGISATDGNTVWTLTQSELLAVLYAGIVASAVNYGATTWSNKILGPALVALCMPLQPFASALLSKIFLGNAIYLGSIIGGSLIIAGLYMVTWASYRERQEAIGTINHVNPVVVEPLLTNIYP